MSLKIPKEQPKNLCLAPFIMTRPDVRGWNSPCPFGAGDWVQPDLNAEQQWNAEELNELRQKHLNNECASECNRCYTEEQVGKFIGIYLLGPLVVMLCWNFVMPYIFGLKAINYLHAAALLIISRFITLK